MFYIAKITKLHEEWCVISEKCKNNLAPTHTSLWSTPKSPISSRHSFNPKHYPPNCSLAAPCQAKNKTSLLGGKVPQKALSRIYHTLVTLLSRICHTLCCV